MASARTAQLLSQRGANKASSLFGTKIKILAPQNGALASIAKKTIQAELQSNIGKYNDGLLSNEDMRAYLMKVAGDSSLTVAEKTDVEDQLRDFDTLVQKDKLEAAFKAAPENSLAQYQAAQSLSSFYGSRAAGMASGTPAQSQALQNQAQWAAKAGDIQTSTAKTQRQNQRYIAEQQINQLPTNSPERAYQKAEMWKGLYDQAVADGDTTVANQYAANYQQELTVGQELEARAGETASKQAINAEKDDIRNTLGALANDYHDGRINEQQYLEALYQIAPRVDATNDYGLINTINRTSDTVYKSLQKGGKKTVNWEGKLPTQTKAGGAGGVVQSDWDDEDYGYTKGIRAGQELVNTGDPEKQAAGVEIMRGVITQHLQEVADRMVTIRAAAEANPTQKILYNGVKQMAKNIESQLLEDQKSLDEQVSAFESENFVLKEIPPKRGTELGKGKAETTWIIVDPTTMDEGTFTIDDKNVAHDLMPEKKFMSKEEAAKWNLSAEAYLNNNYAQRDSYGRHFVQTGNQAYESYDAATDKAKQYIYTPGEAGKPVISKSPETVKVESEQAMKNVKDFLKADEQQRIKDYQDSKAPGLVEKTVSDVVTAGKNLFSNITKIPITPPQKPISPLPTDAVMTAESVGPTTPTPVPTPPMTPVKAAVPTPPPSNFIGPVLPTTTSSAPKQVSAPSSYNYPAGFIGPKLPTTVTSYIKSPTQVSSPLMNSQPLAAAAQNYTAPKTVQQPGILDTLKNTVKNLGTRVSSYFGR